MITLIHLAQPLEILGRVLIHAPHTSQA
jgi:hypothetical protein